MHGASVVAFLLLSVSQVWAAEEPSGCDKFKWNIDRERVALTAADRAKLASGSELNAVPGPPRGQGAHLTCPDNGLNGRLYEGGQPVIVPSANPRWP